MDPFATLKRNPGDVPGFQERANQIRPEPESKSETSLAFRLYARSSPAIHFKVSGWSLRTERHRAGPLNGPVGHPEAEWIRLPP